MSNFAARSPEIAALLKDVTFRKPAQVFEREMVLDLGGVRVRIMWLGPGHTRGDTVMFVEEDRVLFAGDLTMKGLFPAFASPQSRSDLAEKILTSKAALEGERKQVTVLFADLKGSMELLADRDPEEARKLLDPVLERMMEAVHRYEGTVNQLMGDGIMALFGAPLAHEDHAVRACYAALRMQDAVTRYAEEVHRTLGIPLHIRVGLNSGEVVVRTISNDLHMDYTAVGQTTHLAARMEQMAMPGSILITPETLMLVEGYVLARSLGKRPVKGLEAPVDVFEVTGASPIRSRLRAAAVRLTRFVGRDTESSSSAGPSAEPAALTDRWWRWSANQASVSRACTGSRPTPITSRDG